MLGDQQLLGLQVVTDRRALQVWLNASSKDIKVSTERKRLPKGSTSLTLSDGLLGRSPFQFKFSPQVTLKPGQHAVVVVSPERYDHTPGWKSFADMVQQAKGGDGK